eukprot:GHUV01033521.1.p1 GENE.GHUV01033521.1~~GHUV01033521.1.p1  ORF type:complete len:270 (+),score=72.76 GHUV01033521.1:815-1624(+)
MLAKHSLHLYQPATAPTFKQDIALALQVAALLLWAIRQPGDTAVGEFWRAYASAFLPSAEQQHSLLLWSGQELAELQDPELATTAVAWQQQVKQAYHCAVRPCFEALYGALHGGSNSSGTGADSSRPALTASVASSVTACSMEGPCSLQEWLWAVATVESRAFGVDEVSSVLSLTHDSCDMRLLVQPQTGCGCCTLQQYAVAAVCSNVQSSVAHHFVHPAACAIHWQMRLAKLVLLGATGVPTDPSRSRCQLSGRIEAGLQQQWLAYCN